MRSAQPGARASFSAPVSAAPLSASDLGAGDLAARLARFARDFHFSGGRYVHLGHRIDPSGETVRPPLRFLSSLGADLDPWRAGDPAAPRAFADLLPFPTSTRDDLALPDQQRAWLSVERLRGVEGGIVVPVQDYASGPAYVSLFGRAANEAGGAGAAGARLAADPGTLTFRAIAFHNRARKALPVSGAHAVPLTDRELGCLRHAALGASVPQTASFLGIASRSVELHLSRAVRKLGAANRLHAVAMALRAGLIQI